MPQISQQCCCSGLIPTKYSSDTLRKNKNYAHFVLFIRNSQVSGHLTDHIMSSGDCSNPLLYCFWYLSNFVTLSSTISKLYAFSCTGGNYSQSPHWGWNKYNGVNAISAARYSVTRLNNITIQLLDLTIILLLSSLFLLYLQLFSSWNTV